MWIQVLASRNDLQLCDLRYDIRMVLPEFPALLNSIIIPLTMTIPFCNATNCICATVHRNTTRWSNDIVDADSPLHNALDEDIPIHWTIHGNSVGDSVTRRKCQSLHSRNCYKPNPIQGLCHCIPQRKPWNNGVKVTPWLGHQGK